MEKAIPIPLVVALLAGIAALAASALGVLVQVVAMTAILGAGALLAMATLRPQQQRQAIRVRTRTLPPRRR